MHLIVYITMFFLFIYSPINQVFGIENNTQTDDRLVKILENYWQWWSNSPEDNPDSDPVCSIHINTDYSFVFLLNPFETGNNNYDCTETPIPQGYSIMFPLITSFCSQGDVGLVGKPYESIKNCALNLDRGIIKGKVIADDKPIVDLVIDNGDGVSMKSIKKIIHNIPESSLYYKEIFSPEFVDILATNKTIHPNNWQKNEYKTTSIYYNGVIHCDCIVINTNEFEKGIHDIEYTVSAKADPPSPNLIADKWNFISTTNYKLMIR